MTESEIRKIIQDELNKRDSVVIHQSRLVAKSIKQRHIDGIIIFSGLAADRPTNGDTGILAWWATDTGVLSIWTGSAWLSETLT